MLDRILSILLVGSAAAIAATVVYTGFFRDCPGMAPQAAAEEFVESWKEILPMGLAIGGDEQAPVTILVLSDLECPACAGFHAILAELLERRPGEARALFVSHPLSYHQSALSAARAAECAEEFGRFRAWVDAVFAKQDSLGMKSWRSYAAEAGIADPDSIQRCADRDGTTVRIEAGLAFGSKIRLSGIPTVLVNGWRYRALPLALELDQGVTAISRISSAMSEDTRG